MNEVEKVDFTCSNCNENLTAYFFKNDKTDVIRCNCGKVWTVIKPIDTNYQED